jgi:hypothetical protein
VSLVSASTVMGMPMIVGAHTEDEVQLALDWASDSIESYCERSFAYVASDTVFINPYRGTGGKHMALLPNPPVSNVSAVQAQMPIDSGLAWVQLQYYDWEEDGLVYDTTRYYGMFGVTGSSFWSGVANADGWFDYGGVPSWPTLPRSLQVTYDHGYILPGNDAVTGVPSLPSGVVNAVIRGAALFLSNPVGVIEGRVGEITNRFADPTGGPAGWLDEKLLGEYRLVHL